MLLLSSLLKLFILCFDKLLGTDVLFDANHRFVPFNFLFSIFSVIVQLCLVILFPVYLTENLSSIFSHKGFVHLRDSNMLFFFLSPTVHLLPSPLILNCITLCCFLQLLAEETVFQ